MSTTNTPSIIVHRANERGHADHGWLNSHHSFSFAGFYDPEKVNFGVLRVLNDDVVAAGMGFGTHPHDNMEIISIPLQGELAHRDNMGNTAVIKQGDIQVMSAGTGIQHSEYNNSKGEEVRFLQIWIIPNQRNVTPRYDQISLDPEQRKNKLEQVLSPNPEDSSVWIHQDAWFYMGRFDKDVQARHTINRVENGVYAFVLNGAFDVSGQTLNKRDAIGIYNTDTLQITALTNDAEILLMDIPMTMN
jgi:redox-sensitive bicupin YhaK (pirin superfamily)